MTVTDITFHAPGYEGEVTAYRARRCRLLAFDKELVKKTTVNAETYVLFATGVTLDKVNWYPNGYEENTGI